MQIKISEAVQSEWAEVNWTRYRAKNKTRNLDVSK